MASKSGVEIAADFTELARTLGLISGMSKEVKTNRYLGDVISYVHDNLSKEFDAHMDLMVESMPQRFSHVYEWDNTPGDDRTRDRLWTHKMLGSGGKRNATWVWKASVRPIPTPQERKASNPDDPIAQVPDDELEKLSKRRYVFYWKAPIMEYDLGVTITPKYAKALFVPTGDPSNPFVFVNYYRNLQPGGEQNTGQFTLAWSSWWGAEAPVLFETKLKEGLEQDLTGITKGIRQGTRTRPSKMVSLSATKDFDAAFQSGEEWARGYIKERLRKRRTSNGNR